MKKILYFSVAFFALSFLACQDGRDEIKTTADLPYYKNIGNRIPTETGYRWIDTYRTKLNLAGREKPSGYALSKANLAEMSASVEQLVGVAFQHAIDESGLHHFLVIPVDATLQIWSTDKTIIDANTDAPISYADARQWAKNYQVENPESIWFHFFGARVFEEMYTISFFEYIQIEPAINDENLKPQVLLIINDLDATASGGRTEAEESVVFDGSWACPPCPVTAD